MLRNRRSPWNKKKYQHDMNKVICIFNAHIKNDWLWNARFSARQIAFYARPYEDHSGMECDFVIELTDHKTGRTEIKHFNQYNADYEIYHWANHCITEVWDVWSEEPNPNAQARLEGRVPD